MPVSNLYILRIAFPSARELALGVSRLHLLSRCLHFLFSRDWEGSTLNASSEPIRRMHSYLNKFVVSVSTTTGAEKTKNILLSEFIFDYMKTKDFLGSESLRSKLAVDKETWNDATDIQAYSKTGDFNLALDNQSKISLGQTKNDTSHDILISATSPIFLIKELVNAYLFVRAVHVASARFADKLCYDTRDDPSVGWEPVKKLFRKYGLLSFDNSASEILHYFSSDFSSSIKPYIDMVCCDAWWRTYSALDYSLDNDGASAFKHVNGEDLFEYYKLKEEENEKFNLGISCVSAPSDDDCIDSLMIPVDKAFSVTDIGGGLGLLAKMIKQRFPKTAVTLFDQQHVVEDFLLLNDNSNVLTRSGNFFKKETIPRSSNLYILKFVLHNHDDKKAISILKSVAAAMPRGGTLSIIEKPLRSEDDCEYMHLSMMLLKGAKERTVEQYKSLLVQAGFSQDSQHIWPGSSSVCIISSTSPELKANPKKACLTDSSPRLFGRTEGSPDDDSTPDSDLRNVQNQP